ncbi:hypothetical protein lerEdw1_005435 [Lerista edwardsae]|nr:hypothetical protein lerEdw1_005435 [Lerista edwardsae]
MPLWSSGRISGGEIASMSFRDVDMKEFLVCINLGQYFPNFQDFGYNTLQDCVGINNRVLQQIGISPTGHRRRILKQLEALFAKRQAKSTPTENQKTGDTEELGNGCFRTLFHSSDTHTPNSNKAGITSWRSREWTNTDFENNGTYEENNELGGCESLEDKGDLSSDLDSLSCHVMSCSTAATPGMQSVLKNVMPENISWAENPLEKVQPAAIHLQLDCGPEETPSSPSSAFSSSEMKFGKDEHIMVWGLQNSSDSPPVSPFVEFKGEMVENDLYNRAPSPMKTAPRPTRSFMLRHRPVPEIPGSSTSKDNQCKVDDDDDDDDNTLKTKQ